MEVGDFVTKGEMEVLAFIKEFMLENQYAPVVAEIAAGIGYSAKSSVFSILVSLKNKGFVDWETGKPRTIRIKGLMITEIMEEQNESNNDCKLQGRFWKNNNSR